MSAFAKYRSLVFIVSALVVTQVLINIAMQNQKPPDVECKNPQQTLPRDYILEDSSSPPPRKKLRVLFLREKGYIDMNMDRWFFQIIDAARRNPGIEVVDVWGNGFPGWVANKPIWQNINDTYGRVDVVHVHELHPPPELRGVVSSVNSVFFHELHCPQGLGKCVEADVFMPLDMLFFAYANSGVYLTPWTKGKLYIHLPHGAEKSLFYHPVTQHRPINVSLAGKVSALYPLRSKLHKHIENGEIPGTIRKHPGYYKFEFEENKYGNQSVDDQLLDYANQLKTSKIVLMCSSLRRYALRKYVEAAMAGALVIADLPAERQEEFKEFVVEINRNMDATTIRDIINHWLADDKARMARAAVGQRIVMERYTYDHFVERLLDGWHTFMEGKLRGLLFPNEFTITKPWCLPDGKTPREDCGGGF
eukprot:TRINITY_DN27274_c0_g1_i1.p1 TRINITY_DN27274_c0_g1~~TRINITY_DN27274_c0_g1_i1.p1  ORF type:complete len:420 (+),score=120.69 TRINITY_DN27274_c0_g1_i1:122-1381(+)